MIDGPLTARRESSLIPLSNYDFPAIIDSDLLQEPLLAVGRSGSTAVVVISQMTWYAHVVGGKAYARTKKRFDDGLSHKVALHRLILQAAPGQVVDHINGNSLDSRQENLRFATLSENQFNRRKSSGTSRFKGVRREGNRWRAEIRFDGRQRHIGLFVNEIDAALAYDREARKYMGKFVRPNFPHEGENGCVA